MQANPTMGHMDSCVSLENRTSFLSAISVGSRLSTRAGGPNYLIRGYLGASFCFLDVDEKKYRKPVYATESNFIIGHFALCSLEVSRNHVFDIGVVQSDFRGRLEFSNTHSYLYYWLPLVHRSCRLVIDILSHWHL
jgi:hypothetical protein